MRATWEYLLTSTLSNPCQRGPLTLMSPASALMRRTSRIAGTNSAEHARVVFPCPGGPKRIRFKYRFSMVFGDVIRNAGGFGAPSAAAPFLAAGLDFALSIGITFGLGTTATWNLLCCAPGLWPLNAAAPVVAISFPLNKFRRQHEGRI